MSADAEPRYLTSLRDRLALEISEAERARGAFGEYEHVRALRAESAAFGAPAEARPKLSRLFWSDGDGEPPRAA